jgi:cytosine deaminase
VTRTLLTGGVGADGRRLDVVVDDVTATVVEAGANVPAPTQPPPAAVIDAAGSVVLPAPVEPHAHLDKALTGLAAPNPSGDLLGAVAAWQRHRPSLTRDDVVARATTAVEALVGHGVTAVRTHVDVAADGGLTAAEALVAVREDVTRRGLAHLELVALVRSPLAGEAGRANRWWLDAALDAGVDVAGGCPNLDPDPSGASAVIVAAAARRGVRVDVHCDETLDPAAGQLAELARLAVDHGVEGRVVASHCVSLGMQDPATQRRVAAAAAGAGVAVVTLPQTNLYLQGRGVAVAAPRGLTAVGALLDAGVVVAAGGDNARDPFCAVGRLDPVETAALLVMAGHLSPLEAWRRCTVDARACLGLAGPGRADLVAAVGDPAELVLLEGRDLAEALAAGSEARTTIHRGRVVATTTVTRTLVTGRASGQAAASATAAALRPLAPHTPAPG